MRRGVDLGGLGLTRRERIESVHLGTGYLPEKKHLCYAHIHMKLFCSL